MPSARFEISERSIGRAMAFAEGAGTAQLVIVRAGDVLVDEVHAAGPIDVYAVQKGLVSVMFGIGEELGLLNLDDPVSDFLGAGWTRLSRAAEADLRIRNVLDMTTGMDDELGPLGDVGVTWRYDNIAYNYLKTVLATVTDRPMTEVTKDWLFEPLGMDSSCWVDRPVRRPDGKPITGLQSTARDLARFGSMMLAGGSGLVPPEYLQTLGRPGSQENPAWGLCWWNNDQEHYRLPRREAQVRSGAMTPEAPADMIAARGAMENRLYVVPSLDLVVARTAVPMARGERPVPFDGPFWRALVG